MGISPYDELCLKPIKWLKNNKIKGGWGFSKEDKTPLSFTTALALWSIHLWNKYIIKETFTRLEIQPFILKSLRRRITILITIVTIIFFLFFIFYTPGLTYLITYLNMIINDYGIYISVIGAIISILGISGLYPLLKFSDRKFLDEKISKTFKKIKDIIKQFIYVE